MSTTYHIDDGHWNEIVTGVSEREVWEIAQRIATERGESVFVARDEPESEYLRSELLRRYSEVKP